MRGLIFLFSFAAATRTTYLLSGTGSGWKFELLGANPPPCADPATTFPVDMSNKQCLQLTQIPYAGDANACQDACCADDTCAVWQFCTNSSCSPTSSCWIGPSNLQCQSAPGWASRGRTPPKPPAPPAPGGGCSDPHCQPSTDDSTWRVVDVPHDFVVEGNFTPTAIMSHGYLPLGKGWYRRHLTVPAEYKDSPTVMFLDVDGAQSSSTVYLNGFFVGAHTSGYTAARYFLNASWINFGGDNVLAVFVDGTQPDGWWYDGGGLYRHVWLTAVTTPGAYLAPWGIYAPSSVDGAITWAGGAPFGNGLLSPSVDVWNNGTAPSSFSLSLTVFDAAGVAVGSAGGSGSVAAGGVATWAPAAPIALPGAALWHLVEAPLKPALYTLAVALSIGGAPVDAQNVTFGIRRTAWSNATGFWLNDVNTKILGTANHQDFAGMGVAFPDALQHHRVAKLKQMGVNGWRTAHNPPTPALLDAMDELGMVCWDENHRNGQLDQVPLLILRDRNHPSVVIWSICNEVLCNTAGDSAAEASKMSALMHALDPLGNRPVSANQNGWVGPHTPLDVQGFDYATSQYDSWHAQAPWIPSISSETSSAVSDRGEYKNDAAGGHVQAYDNQYPGWGQSAEQAWGGVGEKNGQGILTRPFISGGWTWTGWDYKGEPTPYSWPDINSHFGILDIAGFEKDRFWWYAAWFLPSKPLTWVLPHWNWAAGDNYPIWVYSNAAEVELFVNDVSQGRKPSPQYGHVEFAAPFSPGSLRAVGYAAPGDATPASSALVNTTGAPAALAISVKDGVGATLLAGCSDVALVQVFVVDKNGLVVPTANNTVTFAVTGPAKLGGTGNGDPACHTNDKDSTRPAFHGKVLAVVLGGSDAGQVQVTASADGFSPVTVTIPQQAPQGAPPTWCYASNPRL